MAFTAVILAAGVGERLGPAAGGRPKALLRFGGESLLARHVRLLDGLGVRRIAVAVGYEAALIHAELGALQSRLQVVTVENPDFRAGSIVSLDCMAEFLTADDDVLLMDADVLYDPRILARLAGSAHRNCLLLDRDFEPGDEPVKICVRDGVIVDFRKKVGQDHDFQGESVGFFRFTAAAASSLAAIAAAYVGDGRRNAPYEEAVRDLLLAGPADAYGWEDITGLPWIEIDFPDDVARAATDILPRIGGG